MKAVSKRVMVLVAATTVMVSFFVNCGAEKPSDLSVASSGTPNPPPVTPPITPPITPPVTPPLPPPATPPPPVISLTRNGTASSVFNCPADTIVLKVTGAGATPLGCLGFNVPGRTPAVCDAANKFSAITPGGDWSYTSMNDTWTNSANLNNHPAYVPGTYNFNIKKSSADTAVSATYTIVRSDGGNSANCLVPSGPPNCPNHGPLGNFPDLASLIAKAETEDFCVNLNGIHVPTSTGKFGPCTNQVCD